MIVPVAATLTAGTLRSTDGDCDIDHAKALHLIAQGNAEGSTGLPFLTCSNIGKTANNQTPLLAFQDVAHTLRGEGFDASEDGTGRGTPLVPVAFQPGNLSRGYGPSPSTEVFPTLKADHGRGSSDQDPHVMVPVPVAVAFVQNSRDEVRMMGGDGSLVGALAAETGAKQQCYIAQPVVAYAVRTANTSANGHGIATEVAHTLDRAQGQAIASTSKDYGGDATADLSPTLRAMNHADSHANGGGQVAVAFHGSQDPDVSGDITHPVGRNQGLETCIAFQERGRSEGPEIDVGGDIAYALTAPAGGGRAQERNILTPTMQVRRLMPIECERLQGFPDNYTAIPWRGKSADQCPDGPRYKALGNSWAVPVVAWLGARIDRQIGVRA